MNDSLDDFITPPNHIHLLAKKIFGEIGEIIDSSIAYLEPNGGGPTKPHTHTHSHLFIIIEGQAKILLDKLEIILNANESYLVYGNIPHSIWNDTDKTTKMIGISVRR